MTAILVSMPVSADTAQVMPYIKKMLNYDPPELRVLFQVKNKPHDKVCNGAFILEFGVDMNGNYTVVSSASADV
jgi:hypothetical protein